MAKRDILINIIVAVITIILFLSLFEVTLRIFFPQKLYTFQFDDKLIYKLTPNVDTVHYYKAEFNAKFTTNSKGIVGEEEYLYEKENEKYRIIMLGDSFIEARQVENNEKASWLLENNLRKKRFNVDVINMGVSGYGTDQEVYYLISEGLKYNPNLVILNIFVGNDISETAKDDVYKLENDSLVKNKVKIATYRKVWASIRRHSHVASFFSENFLKPLIFKKTKNKEGLKEIPIRFLNNLDNSSDSNYEKNALEKVGLLIKKMKNTLELNNIKLLVVIIPEKEQLSNEIFQAHYNITDLSTINIIKYQSMLINILNAEKIECIDLLPILSNEQNNTFYFEEDSHFNIKGNKKLAETIQEWILESNIINSKIILKQLEFVIES